MIYRHINGKIYIKLINTKVKIGNDWVDAILYMCLYFNRSGMFYVRTKSDFHNKFKKI